MKLSLALLLLLAVNAGAEPLRFYLGTYTAKPTSQGIYTGTVDSETGALGPLVLAAQAHNPSFVALSPDQKYLYALTSNFGGATDGTVEAFRAGADGLLTRINELPTGSVCAHVSLDATGRNVFLASYDAATVMAFQTKPDGALDRRTAFYHTTGSGPNPARQTRSYPHSMYADPENRHVYACDLGADKIWIYDLDAAAGTLTPGRPAFAQVPPGSGPRHIAFSPDGRFVYVNGEMGMNVTVFARTPATGALTPVQTVSSLPPGADTDGVTTSEIICHPTGKWLYVSNRGRGSMVVYTIGADGKLTWLQDLSAEVKVPRGFGIDAAGRWLITGGQTDDKIAVFKIDARTGKLSFTGQTAMVGAPICVIFDPAVR